MSDGPHRKTPTSALQRLRIRAMGQAVPDDCDKEELKAYYTKAIGPTWGPPTKAQLDMAEHWGVFVDPQATQQELSTSLTEFMLCRAWVYSVLRHMNRERWKFYPTAVVTDETVNAISAELMGNPDLYRQIMDCEPSTKFVGDVWYRFDPPLAQSPAFRFVKKRIRALHPPAQPDSGATNRNPQ